VANITVIGAGEAGIHFIKEIRSLGDDSKIVLIDKRDLYFERRNVFNCWMPKGECRIIHFNDEFCLEHSLEYIKAVVERINPSTKKIFFKEHPSIDFDTLIVASGAVSNDLSIRGDFREGFFYLSDIDPLNTRDYLNISKDIIVYASTILGVRMALFLSSLGKDVKLIAGDLDFLGGYKQRFMDLFKDRQIDTYLNCRIEEAIGEGSVKAVRITLPKVFSSQIVFVDSGFTANRIFSDSGINIRDNLYTDYDGIYVLGEAANSSIDKDKFFINNAETARRQARSLAYHISRRRPDGENRLNTASFSREEFLEQIIEKEISRSA